MIQAVVIERWLQISIAIMVTLSAALLGFAQHDAILPVIMAVVAITSVIFTDVLRWFRLHRLLANVAMLLATFFSLRGFIGVDSHQKLLAIANLMVYVQIIMLYQEKKVRLYGHLIIFSLLQIVVGTLLSQRFEFIGILSIYMVSALFALSLLSLLRQLVWIEQQNGRRQKPTKTKSSVASDENQFQRLMAEPIVHYGESVAELGRKVVGWGYARILLTTCFCTLLFGGIFFLTVPRSLESSWHQPRLGMARTVGFANEISLGQMGKVLKNHEVVMRVAFTDSETGLPYEVFGTPYFRGSALCLYRQDRRNPTRTNWSTQRMTFRWRDRLPQDQGFLPERDRVQQDVLYRLSRDPILMAVGPVFQLEETPGSVRYDWLRQRVLVRNRDEGLPREQFRYKVGTTAFRAGNQQAIRPIMLTEEYQRSMLLGELQFAGSYPSRLVDLKRVAREILQVSNIESENRIGRVRELERHLRSEERFTYSLDLERIRLRREFQRDPVEDFVVNHHTGHCEYFASALALMCRSQGIPARVVVGYKGGEYNPTGQFYSVRQSDAHAWVEVFLEPRHLSDEMRSELPKGLVGAWMRADPTIPREDQLIKTLRRSLFDTISDSFDYMQLLWDNYVLHLGPEQQQKAVYDPLRLDPSNSFSGHWSVSWMKKYGIDLQGNSPVQWFDWRGAVMVMLLVFSGLVGYQLLSRVPCQWLFKLAAGRLDHWQRRRSRIDFYARLERLLRRHRWRRLPGQTPREFSQQVAHFIDTRLNLPTVKNLPGKITEAYYQLRFGGRELTMAEQDSINQALTQLEQALAQAVKH